MSPEQFKHYLVGDPKYDAEHYLMFDRINLFRALQNPSTEESDCAIQDILLAFTSHCAEEEAYMEATEFKYLKYHKEMHADLARKLQHYSRMHSHGFVVKGELYDFSIALAHHIDEADRQFYDLHKI